MGREDTEFSFEFVRRLAGDRPLQSAVARILDQFKRDCVADCALFAIPENRTDVRVFATGIDGMEPDDVSLPLIHSPQCITVIERRDTLAVADVSGLPPDRVCTFMRAEDFSGFLGVPVLLMNTAPVAVVAALTHVPYPWKMSDIARARDAGEEIALTLRAAGVRFPEDLN